MRKYTYKGSGFFNMCTGKKCAAESPMKTVINPMMKNVIKKVNSVINNNNNNNDNVTKAIKSISKTIEKFEKFAHQTNYKILHNIHYLINPIYEYKFNLKPKIQFGFIKAIPWVRNFFTTCVYYLITPNTH